MISPGREPGNDNWSFVKRVSILPVILFALMACEYESPVYNDGPGIGNLYQLTLNQNQSQLVAENGLDSALVSGAGHTINKIGRYMGLTSEFAVKFNNFTPIIGWANVDTVIFTKAWIELYPYKVWPADSTNQISLSIEQIASDSSLNWSNYISSENIDSLWDFFSQNGNSLLQDTLVNLTEAVQIPLDLDLLTQWRKNEVVNNGLRFHSSEENAELMAAFYAYDHSLENSPKLKIQCTVEDTTGVLPADTLVTLYSTGDLQYSVNRFVPDDSELLLSQGAVFMPWIKMPLLRDSIPENAIINKAYLHIAYEQSRSILDESTKTVQIRYLYSDNWDSYTSSISSYLLNSAALYDTAQGLVFDVSKIIQYYIAGGAKDTDARFRFNLTEEHEAFSRIYLDPASLSLDIQYTMMTIKPGEEQ